MPRKRSRNPIGFTPWPVTFFVVAILAALYSSLVSYHNIIPSPPLSSAPLSGINLTEAWHDLQFLTNGYHPYNSRRNDVVRDWLLRRIEQILKRNGALKPASATARDLPAEIFNDIESNLAFSSSDSALSVAFTGTNIIVYIRGSDDEAGRAWEQARTSDEYPKGGVLVNAHFDSVPSGFGATDDGVGVISVLQLISYFTVPENQPKRGIVALLNNGEEDYLNGAYAFSQHPLSKFPHTFLNLEGAGAGGRAVLFRSTDTEVTRYYKKAPRPFGTVSSSDGFKAGLVRSQTDYVVFNGLLGMRGLDVAFMEPRSRYHTREDSTRYTSKGSLWHMLSAAIATVEGLASDTSGKFDGEPLEEGMVPAGKGSDSVWFDIYGRSFAVFELHSFFAVSVTLLVVTPFILIALTALLSHFDKWYPFTLNKSIPEADDSIPIDGLRAFFRTPIVSAISTAALVGLSFLLTKINPYIIYSSEYSVWAMFLSAWFVVYWFLMRGADAMRPSALHRFYTLMWMYIGNWLLLVGVTVMENNLKMSGGYFVIIYFASVFVALLISYLELFALPRKTSYAELIAGIDAAEASSVRATTGESEPGENHDHDDDATERTSLLRDDRATGFSSGYGTRRRRSTGLDEIEPEVFRALPRPYRKEQAWSGKLPSWTWLLQFLILGPMPIILVGQLALFTTSALYQTPADGSPVLNIYIFITLLTVLLLAPATPFIHRISFPLPTLVLLIFGGTLIYNLLAFPFSDSSRLKLYFLQSVDLDSGINSVSLTGLDPYVRTVANGIPSAFGKHISCDEGVDYTARKGLTKCSWPGLPPNVLEHSKIPPVQNYSSWLTYTATREANTTTAHFRIEGRNTRACRLLFDTPIESFHVAGYTVDPRFPAVGEKGCKSIRLWTREWGGAWDVDVTWKAGVKGRNSTGLDGKVVCLWSDANEPSTIPAYHEVLRFMPRWSVATKLSDGLVEGVKVFKI
ncbi:putative zinc metalloprotease [Microthyrium microscopicum]|uniref:Peptide hydrolase n=1 Tax=Microthyrium microscopicum TaxID=703497 RepID=A0A6A6TWA1_9PEZI|nr:putative zinc metalloprotease [Microthyrium microscopicum]